MPKRRAGCIRPASKRNYFFYFNKFSCLVFCNTSKINREKFEKPKIWMAGQFGTADWALGLLGAARLGAAPHVGRLGAKIYISEVIGFFRLPLIFLEVVSYFLRLPLIS